MPPHAKILVIGDEPELLHHIRSFFTSASCEILSVENCTKAVHAAGIEGADVILLDVPECSTDGVGMAAVGQHFSKALFIVLSASTPVEKAVPDPPFTVYGYLRKPFIADEIVKTIENALDHKRLIHEHKMSELALLESEGRLANLVVSAMMGISIIQDHQVVYQNPAQKTIFEGRQEPFSLDDFSCVHEDDLKKVREIYRGILDKKTRTAEWDFRFTLTDLETSKPVMKWVQCRASAYRHQGEAAVLVNMMDITHARELENLVMIKDKMTSLGRVAAGIAHEIRNPLTGINSYLFTLEDLTSTDSVAPDNIELIRRITSQIQVASNKIESVIKRVLDFSKPSKPNMEMIRINDALAETIGLSAVAIRKKDIKLEQSLQDDIPRCFGDVHLVEQVVLNLINNAANAMENNSGEKIIRISSYSKNRRVYVSVADSGPGIPEDLKRKIFDPFFTTHADGSGIGLSISQRIVADHGGTIKVGRSEWGGAEFTIDLPVEKRMHPR